MRVANGWVSKLKPIVATGILKHYRFVGASWVPHLDFFMNLHIRPCQCVFSPFAREGTSDEAVKHAAFKATIGHSWVMMVD